MRCANCDTEDPVASAEEWACRCGWRTPIIESSTPCGEILRRLDRCFDALLAVGMRPAVIRMGSSVSGKWRQAFRDGAPQFVDVGEGYQHQLSPLRHRGAVVATMADEVDVEDAEGRERLIYRSDEPYLIWIGLSRPRALRPHWVTIGAQISATRDGGDSRDIVTSINDARGLAYLATNGWVSYDVLRTYWDPVRESSVDVAPGQFWSEETENGQVLWRVLQVRATTAVIEAFRQETVPLEEFLGGPRARFRYHSGGRSGPTMQITRMEDLPVVPPPIPPPPPIEDVTGMDMLLNDEDP